MEGYCLTGQSPQRAVVPMEEEEEELHIVRVGVTLIIQHAMRKRHTVMWSAPLYNIFPYYLTNGTIFDQKSY
jgi:hypothetical protein